MGLLKRMDKAVEAKRHLVVVNDSSQAPSFEELQELINVFAPVIYFHADDECLPVSVEEYLQEAWLVNELGNTRVQAMIKNLPESGTPNSSYYFQHKDAGRQAKKTLGVKTYVQARAHGDTHTDLQYWFLYSRTGSAVANVKWLIDGTIKGYEGKIDLNPVGMFNGTWQRITVRIDNDTRVAEEVYFPNAGKGSWLPIDQVQRLGQQITIYAAKNNFTFYPSAAIHIASRIKINLYSSQLDFCVEHETCKGKLINFSGACELVSAEYLSEKRPSEPLWLNYIHHWGNPNPDYMRVSTLKLIILATFGKNLEFLLSKDVFYELVNYMLLYYSDECRFQTLSPKAKACWDSE